jgi:AraC-like DNA-binding protein
MARPQKEINWDIVEKRMEAGNNAKTICQRFKIDTDTFYRRFKQKYGCSFGDYSAHFVQCGDDDIDYVQYMKAISGNVQMLIWLGRVRRGQKEAESEKEVPKNDEINAYRHKLMLLEAENDELRKKDQSKTES